MRQIASIVRVRVRVIDPPTGVAFALQEGSSGIVRPVVSSGSSLVFDFALKVADILMVPVRFTGVFAQGPAAARFVYICSGVRAGQAGSCWDRRAKVPLSSITADLVREAIAQGTVIEGEIHGLAKDGGPACASVKLLSGWKLK